MGKIVKLGLVLFVITAVTGLILGAVHTVTLEPIRRSQEKAKNEALSATLPGAKDFKAIEIKGDAGIIKEIFEGSDGGSVVGYNFTVTPKGYGGPIEFVVGISNDGLVKDIKILTSSETPGLGAKAADEPFAGQFRDRKAQELAVTKTPRRMTPRYRPYPVIAERRGHRRECGGLILKTIWEAETNNGNLN
ncbi:MAG: FMN-binding protein [Cloacibacillus evryensis]